MNGWSWVAGAVVAALFGYAVLAAQRRRRETAGRALDPGERRIDMVAIDDGRTGSTQIPTDDRIDEA